MKPFPDLPDLAFFFGAEPVVTDRDVPWFYNCLTYRTSRDDNTVECQIEPGYGQLVLMWERGESLLARLELSGIESIELETGKGVEKLLAKFQSRNVLDFELQLRPSIHIKWGTQFAK